MNCRQLTKAVLLEGGFHAYWGPTVYSSTCEMMPESYRCTYVEGASTREATKHIEGLNGYRMEGENDFNDVSPRNPINPRAAMRARLREK